MVDASTDHRNQARDAFSIYNKLVQVLYPIRSGQNREVLKYVWITFNICHCRSQTHRDWDLWGPLILCLTLALMISMNVRSRSYSPCRVSS
jgi:hypothetical protein